MAVVTMATAVTYPIAPPPTHPPAPRAVPPHPCRHYHQHRYHHHLRHCHCHYHYYPH